MPIPSYDQFIDPLLRLLASRPDEVRSAHAYEAMADHFRLTDEERGELLPSRAQAIYQNRIGWAHDRLKRAGLSSSLRRGYWRCTEQGIDFVRQHASPLTAAEVEAIARVEKGSTAGGALQPSTPSPPTSEAPPAPESPEERIESALRDLRESVARDLLETVAGASPSFFERLVLELLHAMGYGTSRADLEQVGGSGDGGIDGIISLDRLGLEKVYVQAKRWKGSVGRPEIQAFYGALAGRRAKKGVFITTSTFTREALDFVSRVEGIVLVDGERLAALMIDHGVGVSHKDLCIPKIDSDYFEDE